MKKLIFIFSFLALICSCNNNSETIDIEKIEFSESEIQMNEDDMRAVYLSYNPKNADFNENELIYNVIPENYFEISSFDKNGCVIHALSEGEGVLECKYKNLSTFLSLKVNKNKIFQNPYISLPFSKINIECGKKLSVYANIEGGTKEDENNYIWTVNNTDICDIQYSAQNAVITAKSTGVCTVNVSNPCCRYSAEMLVIVPDKKGEVVYLTSNDNVINIKENEEIDFCVNLIGGKDGEEKNTFYSVNESNEYFEISGNEGKYHLKGIKEGSEIIEFHNEKSLNNLKIRVNVIKDNEKVFIESDCDYIVFDDNQTKKINISLSNGKTGEWSINIENQDIFSVLNTGNEIYIKPLKTGKSIIRISNTLSDFYYEIMAVCTSLGNEEKQYYIETKSNVIRMIEGEENNELIVDLINGNENDRNSFLWTVEDSSVLNVETADGKVVYSRSAENNEKINGKAYIKALKSGNSKITVTHPKSNNKCIIDVYVFSKEMVENENFEIKGNNLILSEPGKELEYEYEIIKNQKKGNFIIDVKDNSIIDVYENENGKLLIDTKKEGNTSFSLSSTYMNETYNVNVLVNSNLEKINGAVYCDNQILSGLKGNTSYIKIKSHSNKNIDDLTYIVLDNEIADVSKINDVLKIDFINKGETYIIVKNKINSFMIKIICEEITDLNKPYRIMCNDFIETIKNQPGIIEIKNNENLNDYSFEYDIDELQITKKEKNKYEIITYKEGNFLLKISNELCSNTKTVNIISRENIEAFEKANIYCNKNNFELKKGEEIFIELKSTKNIDWNKIKINIEKEDLTDIYIENNILMIKALNEGKTDLNIYGEEINSLQIQFNIYDYDNVNDESYISFPVIFKCVKNKISTISIELKGEYEKYCNNIEYSLNKDFEYKINGNNISFLPVEEGEFIITSKINGTGIIKKCFVYVYANEEEMNDDFKIYTKQKDYNLYKGKSIKIKSYFTDNKEITIQNISWNILNGNSVNIISNNDECIIEGICEGKTIIRVKYNEETYFDFNIYVKDFNSAINEFICDSIIRIKKNVPSGFYIKGKNNFDENIINVNNFEINYDEENINVSVKDNYISLLSENPGDYYIDISKTGYKDKKVLVRVYENETDNSSYIYCEKDDIVLYVNDENEYDIFSDNEINVTVSDPQNILYSVNENKLKIKVLKEGEYFIILENNNFSKRIRINAVNYYFENDEEFLNVPAFIIMKKGSEYNSNVNSVNICNFYFNENEDIIKVTSEGNNFKIEAFQKGNYELKVFSSDKCEKIIKVLVYDENENELINTFNIEKRKYILYKNESVCLIPSCYKMYGEDISYTKYNDEIINLRKKENSFIIQGLKEGHTKIDFNYENQIISTDFYILSNNDKDENLKSVNYNAKYFITSNKSYYRVKEGEGDVLNISFVSFDESQYISQNKVYWSVSDNENVIINAGDNLCGFQVLKKGTYYIYAQSFESQNIYCFTIDCVDENTYNNSVSYLYAEKRNIEIEITEGEKTICIEPKNFENINYEDIEIQIENEEVLSYLKTIKDGKLFLTLIPKKIGKSTINIDCIDNKYPLSITVQVINDKGGVEPYLSSAQNYTVMIPGQMCKIGAELKNYEEVDGNNYRWEVIEGLGNISVIGNGSEVTVYANKKGNSIVRLTHLPTDKYFDFNIIINDEYIDYPYISVSRSVIETKVSSQMDFINVSLFGCSEEYNSYFTVSCDNPSVCSVLNSGNMIYFRGIKKGECLVTVKNEKAGCINEGKIRIIVNEDEEGEVFKLNKNTMYLDKNGANDIFELTYEGKQNIDYSNLKWFIYYEEGKNGNVVSLISNQNRCVVKPLNEGFARIRVADEITGLYSNMGVYVGENYIFSFKDEKCSVTVNESKFIEINLNENDVNNSQFITYSVLNPEIAKVYGKGRVCCVEGIEKGNTVIKAVNSYNGEECEIGVSVTDKIEKEYRLSVMKDTFLLNPRSNEQILKAQVFGSGVNETDQDEIEWEISSDSSGCVSVYPLKGKEVILKLKPYMVSSSSDYGKIRCGQAVIKVKSSRCPEDIKTIFVDISEMDNYFSLEKYSLNLKVSNTGTVTSNILNSRLSDYDDVSWTVTGYNIDKYGNMVEVVRLLNTQGKSCNVYAINEGVCTVSAYYYGNVVQCEINVEADRMFRINGATSIKMFPDIRNDNYIDVSYILRPSQNIPQWTVQNQGINDDISLVYIEELNDKQAIRIRPNGIEGKAKITGIAVGIGQVTINVEIKFEPELTLLESEGKCEIIMTDEGPNEKTFSFYSYPSIYYTKVTLSGSSSQYVSASIIDTENKGDYCEGKIWIKALKEFPKDTCVAVIEQFKDPECTEKINNSKSKIQINITAFYEDSGFSLGFKRGRGSFSFLNKGYNVNNEFLETGNKKEYLKVYDSKKDKNNYPEISLADAEQHYFILKSKHDGSYMKDVSATLYYEENDISFSNTSIDETVKNNAIAKNIPQISTLEQKSDGSYIFDIKVGQENYKYGRQWCSSDIGKAGEYLKYASKDYCYEGKVNLPYLSKNGFYETSIENIIFNTYNCDFYQIDYFTLNGDSYNTIINLELNQNKHNIPDEVSVIDCNSLNFNYLFGHYFIEYGGLITITHEDHNPTYQRKYTSIQDYSRIEECLGPLLSEEQYYTTIKKLYDNTIYWVDSSYDNYDLWKAQISESNTSEEEEPFYPDNYYIDGSGDTYYKAYKISVSYENTSSGVDTWHNRYYIDVYYDLYYSPNIGFILIIRYEYEDNEYYRILNLKNFNSINKTLKGLLIYFNDGLYFSNNYWYSTWFNAGKKFYSWENSYHRINDIYTVSLDFEKYSAKTQNFKYEKKTLIQDSYPIKNIPNYKMYPYYEFGDVTDNISSTNIMLSFNDNYKDINLNNLGSFNYFTKFEFDNNDLLEYLKKFQIKSNNKWYFENKTTPDFNISGYYLLIQWKDVFGKQKQIKFPLNIYFYDNCYDYYVYDDYGKIKSNKNKEQNTSVTEIR